MSDMKISSLADTVASNEMKAKKEAQRAEQKQMEKAMTEANAPQPAAEKAPPAPGEPGSTISVVA